MTEDSTFAVIYADDPDLPGWKRWEFLDSSRFNSFLEPVHVRVEDAVARVRMMPLQMHSNLRDRVHGGALLGFMDISLFAAGRAFGALQAAGAMTVDLSAQFIDAGRIGVPIEARLELLRETRNMLFMRGLIVQEEVTTIASFSGTLRKAKLPQETG